MLPVPLVAPEEPLVGALPELPDALLPPPAPALVVVPLDVVGEPLVSDPLELWPCAVLSKVGGGTCAVPPYGPPSGL